jgi:hypothetical protein
VLGAVRPIEAFECPPLQSLDGPPTVLFCVACGPEAGVVGGPRPRTPSCAIR